MYLNDNDRPHLYCRFDAATGLKGDFFEKNSGKMANTIMSGFCKETTKGWVFVYGKDGELIFQYDTMKWKLTGKETYCSRSSGNVETFFIKDENKSFEVSYDHWLKDSDSFIDMDLPEEDHDFFAYVIWLCKPENSQRIADKWSTRKA